MLTEYRKLPWPRNLWSVIFHREISEEDLPEDWERALDHVLKTLDDQENEDILRGYFCDRAVLREIGERYGIGLEAVRQRMGKAIRTLQRPSRMVFLTHGLDGGQKLLAENRVNAIIADNEPVDMLNLSTRANNCLKRAHIETVGQLRRCGEESLLEIRNMGRKTLEEIREHLSEAHSAEANSLQGASGEQPPNQDDDKERLVALLLEAEEESWVICDGCGKKPVEAVCESLADRLLSGGVTVRPQGTWEEVVGPDRNAREQGRVPKRCTACGWTSTSRTNYCSNCGAKMKK